MHQGLVAGALLLVAAAQEPAATTRIVLLEAARVDQINWAGRSMTLTTGQGLKYTVYVGPELPAFDQLRSGDVVNVQVSESVVVAVKPGAKPGVVTDRTAAARRQRTPAGGEVLQQLTVTVVIEQIDPRAGVVTYRGGDNRRVTRSVADPNLLAGLKPGDVVEVTYTRERAMTLEKRP